MGVFFGGIAIKTIHERASVQRVGFVLFFMYSVVQIADWSDSSGGWMKKESMNYAGFWIRSGAHIIDFFLLNAVEICLEHLISIPLDLSPFSQQILGVGVTIPISSWYYCVYQAKRGQTVGKKIFGITVMDEKSRLPLTQKQAVFRFFGYLLSYLPAGGGFLMAAFHPEKKGLHDLFAGTLSVRTEKKWRMGLALCLGLLFGLAIAFKVYGPKLLMLF